MKKLALLLITVLLLCLSAGALAGQDGKWFYDVEDGGAIVVSYGFDNDNPETTLDIPAKLGGYPVTGIGYNAFDGCWWLREINLPATIEEIGWYAFSGCYELEEIKLPYGLKSIGQYAFESCGHLKSLDLPDSLTNISSNAFKNCAFTSLEIPASVKTISSFTFANCFSLQSLTIKGKDTYVYDYAFHDELFMSIQGESGVNVPKNCVVNCWKGSSAEDVALKCGFTVKYFDEEKILNGSSSGSTVLPADVTVPAGSFQAIIGDGDVIDVPVFVHVEPTAAQTGKLTYEITLVDAFEEQMDVPEGVSVDVLIPYDQLGITRAQAARYKLTIEHHLKDGSSEFFSTHDKKMNPAKLTKDGLSFTVTSFSQFDVMIEEAAEDLTKALPQTGDDSLPLSMLIAMLGASLIAAFALKRKSA